jgi:hypothetical protein
VPIGTRGCPRCDQQERLAHRDESSAFRRWFIRAAVPLLIFGIWLAIRRQPAAVPDRLDPAPYRNAIETAESVLYRGDRLTGVDRQALSQACFALGEQLRRTPSLAARRASDAMEPFIAATTFEAEMDRLNVVEARTQWEALRQAHFQDAAWFARASQALEEAQTSSSARGVPPDADRYEPSLTEITALANRLQDGLEQLPDDPEDLDGDTYDRWQGQRRDTKSDIERIRQGFPLERGDVDQRWKLALRKLNQALETVGRIAGPDVRTPTLVPRRSSARVRLLEAQAALRAAREAVADAPR